MLVPQINGFGLVIGSVDTNKNRIPPVLITRLNTIIKNRLL